MCSENACDKDVYGKHVYIRQRKYWTQAGPGEVIQAGTKAATVAIWQREKAGKRSI